LTDPKRRRRRRLFVLVTIAGVLGFGVVGAELVLRVAAPQPPSWLSIYRPHPRLPLFALQQDTSAEVDTGETKWTIVTDANGFRVNATQTTDDSRPVALWLGDSYTFGHGVNHEQSWVGRLAADPERRYRHVNAGVPSYGVIHYRAVLDDLLAQGITPKLVLVVTFVGNDFHDCVWDKNLPVRDGILGNPGGVKVFLKRRFHLYRLLSKLKHSSTVQHRDPYSEVRKQLYSESEWKRDVLLEALPKYRDALAAIAKTCAARGVEVAGVVIPTADAIGPIEGVAPLPGDPRLPVTKALAAFEAAGISATDMTPALVEHSRAEVYFRYDGHLTELGHSLVVKTLRGRCQPLKR
jgi:hypothetical protein